MSRGPGHIERAIRELFIANPDLAFGVVDLVEHCFLDADPEHLEKKHTATVIRAARKVVDGDPDWTIWRGEGQGRALIFVNQASLQSHCLGWLIADMFHRYRSPKRAVRCRFGNDAARAGSAVNECFDLIDDRASLLAELAPGGKGHRLLEARRKFVELHIAERDGDEERARTIRAKMEANKAKLLVDTKAMLGEAT
jgi:hypothetical protein